MTAAASIMKVIESHIIVNVERYVISKAGSPPHRSLSAYGCGAAYNLYDHANSKAPESGKGYYFLPEEHVKRAASATHTLQFDVRDINQSLIILFDFTHQPWGYY